MDSLLLKNLIWDQSFVIFGLWQTFFNLKLWRILLTELLFSRLSRVITTLRMRYFEICNLKFVTWNLKLEIWNLRFEICCLYSGSRLMWSLIMLSIGLCDWLVKGLYTLFKLDRYGIDLDIVIIWVMWSVSLGPKVITLSGFLCNNKFKPRGRLYQDC